MLRLNLTSLVLLLVFDANILKTFLGLSVPLIGSYFYHGSRLIQKLSIKILIKLYIYDRIAGTRVLLKLISTAFPAVAAGTAASAPTSDIKC